MVCWSPRVMRSSRRTAGRILISAGCGIFPSLLLVRPFNEAKREQRSRHYFDAGWALLCIAFMVISATIVGAVWATPPSCCLSN